MTSQKDVLLNLIELYKFLPCLWDKSHVNYKNKYRRLEALSKLLKVYKPIDANATINTVAKRISNLRTCYLKELRKVKKEGPSYVPTLYYYDAMSFLRDTQAGETFDSHEDYQETEPSEGVIEWLSSNEESDSSDTSQSRCESASGPPSPKRSRKKTSVVKIEETTKEVALSEREFEILGKSIGLQLRNVNRKQLAITQKLISDVIYYAKIGRLSENSFIRLEAVETPFGNSSASDSHFIDIPNPKQSPQSVTSSTPKQCLMDPSKNQRSSKCLPKLQKSSDPLIKLELEKNNHMSDCSADYLEDEYE